ncbi:MAG TPA: class I SAM-dependent methyltransferase [Elusimicrobiota bacterium]|nr:class I SAM-dependent methyltransferase [Elusimicrobiota bacterium]
MEGHDLDKSEYLGTSHLLATRSLVHYNDYVFRLATNKFPKQGEVLELGPGLGDFTGRFLNAGKKIDVVETELQFHPVLAKLARKVAASLDELQGRYDAILSVNVLEHIEDDEAILRQLNSKLKPGGLISLYHPAGPSLYGQLDKLVNHYRRYSREEMVRKVQAAGFQIEEVRYVDSLGWLVMWIYKLLGIGDGNVTPWSMKLYDWTVFPISRVLDPLVGRSFGRSIFVLGRKLV